MSKTCHTLMMAVELDYAFLAEYAKSDRGTLTVIGASFTEISVKTFPSLMDLAVAGRIRKSVGDPDPALKIDFHDPDGGVLISVEGNLEDDADSVKYAGKTASVFAYIGPLPLVKSGLYWCKIYIDNELVRELAFTAED